MVQRVGHPVRSLLQWLRLQSSRFPHWKHRSYLLYAAAVPAAGGLLALLVLSIDAYSRLGPGLYAVAFHFLLSLLGGVLGARNGRPLARTLIRVVLPPRLRPVLAYLWLVDGLAPPVTAPRQ